MHPECRGIAVSSSMCSARSVCLDTSWFDSERVYSRASWDLTESSVLRFRGRKHERNPFTSAGDGLPDDVEDGLDVLRELLDEIESGAYHGRWDGDGGTFESRVKAYTFYEYSS